MTHHSVTRTSRGRVVSIDGSCGADDCPEEVVDTDDDSIDYVCPVTGDTIVEVDTSRPDGADPNRPSTTDDLRGDGRRRR